MWYSACVGAISLLSVGVAMVLSQGFWANPTKAPTPSADQPEAPIFTSLYRSQRSWWGVCEGLTEPTRPWMEPVRTSGAGLSHVEIAVQSFLSWTSYLRREALCNRESTEPWFWNLMILIWFPSLPLTSSVILWNYLPSLSSMFLSVGGPILASVHRTSGRRNVKATGVVQGVSHWSRDYHAQSVLTPLLVYPPFLLGNAYVFIDISQKEFAKWLEKSSFLLFLLNLCIDFIPLNVLNMLF